MANNPPSWSDTRGGVSTSYINCLAYDEANRHLYAGTVADGVWRYDPSTGTWTDISGNADGYEAISLAFGEGKLYASFLDRNDNPTYIGVWCYDHASPGPDKWADTDCPVPAVRQLVYDERRGRLYAGTGQMYSDLGGQGLWQYDPATSAWEDLSGDDIGTFKIASLAWGETCSTPVAMTHPPGGWEYGNTTSMTHPRGGGIRAGA